MPRHPEFAASSYFGPLIRGTAKITMATGWRHSYVIGTALAAKILYLHGLNHRKSLQ
jgi:hypothetical protein